MGSQRLAAIDPKNPQFQRDIYSSYCSLGDVAMKIGNISLAQTHYRLGLDVAENLAKADPSNATIQNDLSVLYLKLGQISLHLGNIPEVRELLHKKVVIDERLAAADPKNMRALKDLSNTYNLLGIVLREAGGDKASANEYFLKAIKACERRIAAEPNNADAYFEQFFGYIGAAEAAWKDQSFAQARAWFANAKTCLQQINDRGWISGPQMMIRLKSVANWKMQIDTFTELCDKVERSVSDIDYLLSQPPDQVIELLGARLLVLVKKGDGPGCVATVEAWEKLARPTATSNYDLACSWSHCFSVTKEKVHGDKAMARLKQAVAMKNKGVGHLKASSDFDALRNREDFKALIKELEEKQAADEPKPPG
jgi:tetratricopeptide (TPR) repeat protein